MPAAIDLLASNYRLRGICQEGPGVAELQVLRPAGPFDKSLAISCHWEARTRSCSTPSRWDVETMGRRGPILDLDNGPRERIMVAWRSITERCCPFHFCRRPHPDPLPRGEGTRSLKLDSLRG